MIRIMGVVNRLDRALVREKLEIITIVMLL